MVSHLNGDRQLTVEHFDRLFSIPDRLHRRAEVPEGPNLSGRVFEFGGKSQIEFVILQRVRQVADAKMNVTQTCGGFGLTNLVIQISEIGFVIK
jgi:hypothetical protein